uniref:FTO alpha-ketoglutarate dependent dioxygenase n=1 Tax=Strix occidentalis caurina TaxID=311401 RepID=A0A8D0KU29_STROC
VKRTRGHRKPKKKLLEELGENRLPYMTPADADFHQLWKTKYSKLIFRKSDTVPEELHQMVQEGWFCIKVLLYLLGSIYTLSRHAVVLMHVLWRTCQHFCSWEGWKFSIKRPVV